MLIKLDFLESCAFFISVIKVRSLTDDERRGLARKGKELNKLFAYGTDLLTCGAPCLIVAWSPEGCLNPVLDPTVSMAELELLLVQAGLSTCWGGYLRQVSDRFPEIRQDLGLGENDRVRCAIMVGYAKGEKYLRPVWRPEAPVLWLDGSER